MYCILKLVNVLFFFLLIKLGLLKNISLVHKFITWFNQSIYYMDQTICLIKCIKTITDTETVNKVSGDKAIFVRN